MSTKGNASGNGKKHFRVFSLDTTPDAGLPGRYKALLREIVAYLESVAKDEMDSLRKTDRKPVHLNGRPYTAKPGNGAFLVRLDGPDGSVFLLVRMYDLYMESFYVDEIWFRLNDATAPLPPKTQLAYGKKKRSEDGSEKGYITKTGVIELPWGTSYLELPGDLSVCHASFRRAYSAFRNALVSVLDGSAMRKIGPCFKFCVVGISEGMRYPDCERWTASGLAPHVTLALHLPEWLMTLFRQWRKRSCRMYVPNQPLCLIKSIRVVKRMPALHVILREEDFYQKKDRALSDACKAKLHKVLKVADDMPYDGDSKPLHLQLDNFNYDDDTDADDDDSNNDAAAATAPMDAVVAPDTPHSVSAQTCGPSDAPAHKNSSTCCPAPDALAALAFDTAPKDASTAHAPDALAVLAFDHAIKDAPPPYASTLLAIAPAPKDAAAAPAEALKVLSSPPSIARRGLVRRVKCDPAMYPQRPGAPPCNLYLKSGYCGFASKCKYHHPVDPSAAAPRDSVLYNRYGLPKRKGVEACKNFMNEKRCKHGSNCKFDHPSPRKKQKSRKDELPLAP